MTAIPIQTKRRSPTDEGGSTFHAMSKMSREFGIIFYACNDHLSKTYLFLYFLTNQVELQRFIPAPIIQLARNTCAFRIELNIPSAKI